MRTVGLIEKPAENPVQELPSAEEPVQELPADEDPPAEKRRKKKD